MAYVYMSHRITWKIKNTTNTKVGEFLVSYIGFENREKKTM